LPANSLPKLLTLTAVFLGGCGVVLFASLTFISKLNSGYPATESSALRLQGALYRTSKANGSSGALTEQILLAGKWQQIRVIPVRVITIGFRNFTGVDYTTPT
jgi:hypothetical protein